MGAEARRYRADSPEESALADPGVVIELFLHRRAERRQAERFAAQMPATVDGQPATTKDLSSSGLAFGSERRYEIGSRVEVVIEYILDGHHYPLRCSAEVVRVQADGAAFLIGARLLPADTLETVLLGTPGPQAPP